MITAELLHSLFYYDAHLGRFFSIRGSKNVAPGAMVGSPTARGYRRVYVPGSGPFIEHVLVWIYVYGTVPPDGYEIDHIDVDRHNNRISNLRLATRSQNNINCGIRRNNKSGYRGVCWHPRSGKWIAKVTKDREQMHLGLFETAEEANAVCVAARQKHFGEFARAA